IGFGTKVNMLCLFGPCSPDQYGVGSNAHIIYKPVYCSPCVHDFEIAPCKGNNICMQLIETNEVFLKVQELLNNSGNPSRQNKTNFLYKKGDYVLGKVIR